MRAITSSERFYNSCCQHRAAHQVKRARRPHPSSEGVMEMSVLGLGFEPLASAWIGRNPWSDALTCRRRGASTPAATPAIGPESTNGSKSPAPSATAVAIGLACDADSSGVEAALPAARTRARLRFLIVLRQVITVSRSCHQVGGRYRDSARASCTETSQQPSRRRRSQGPAYHSSTCSPP